MTGDQIQIYSQLVEYLECAPNESLQMAALRVVRGLREQRQRLAAHAVLDIGRAKGDAAWTGIRRAIRLYESCRS